MKNVLVIPVFIPHRGCPHDCLFCNQQKISGTKRDEKAEVLVMETIEEWLKRQGQRSEVQVAFFGGSFTCMEKSDQHVLLEAVQPFIADGRVHSIRCSTRPDCIDSKTIDLLQQYNVTTVELGVQSLDDTVLQKARRGHSAADCENAFRMLKKGGIEVGIQLMPGLPGDTTFSFMRTVKQVIKMGPDFVRIYPCLVVNDSGLEELYENGGYLPLSLSKAIAISGCCFSKFQKAEIDVVRMGLQPSISLAQSVIAGPYHPAFGDLVQSRVWLKKIREKLKILQVGEKLEMHLSHRDLSSVIGQQRRNIKRLEELGFKDRFTLVVDRNMQRGCTQYVVSK
ncbi:MAG: histone acetyltransferase (RNA polymerase elongator complex component) [Desulforhopalus sp.]|jgi:histone acetyltransferase (RNA polymerase elongator complex component)